MFNDSNILLISFSLFVLYLKDASMAVLNMSVYGH
jgi:hypothetical protein